MAWLLRNPPQPPHAADPEFFHESRGERTVNQPDMFYGVYMEEYTAEKHLPRTELPVTLRPLVYTYMIRYEFESGQQ